MSEPDPDISASTRNGVQVLGLCRFSVASKWGFQVGHETPEARRAFLYDPARLEQRFAWFENVTLPGLEAQKDPAFRLIVMMSEDFPAPWRDRMEAHIARVPQLVADFVPYGEHRAVCADSIARHTDPGAKAIAQFRLDDDDAVALDFSRRLRRDHEQLSGVIRNYGLVALDYGKGIEMVVRPQLIEYRPQLTHFWSAGLAVFTRPGDGQHILQQDFQHNLLWQRMTAVSMIDRYMFVRGIHGGNDSRIQLKGKLIDIGVQKLRSILRDRFAIDPVALDAVRERLVLE